MFVRLLCRSSCCVFLKALRASSFRAEELARCKPCWCSGSRGSPAVPRSEKDGALAKGCHVHPALLAFAPQKFLGAFNCAEADVIQKKLLEIPTVKFLQTAIVSPPPPSSPVLFRRFWVAERCFAP